jgi:hypothetical protein
MRPLMRSGVNKKRSAYKFKKQNRKTKVANVAPPPMRGGIRF